MITTKLKNNISINSLISLNECTGLNVSGTESVKEAFGFGGTITSNEGDPEVIISVKFKNNVNISGILIEGSMNQSKNPTSMQLFVNKNSVDFSDIGSVSPTESVNLENNLGKNIPLKIAKFRSVSHIIIYLTNPEVDQIQINNIQFYGSESEKMDFSQIKNVSV